MASQEAKKESKKMKRTVPLMMLSMLLILAMLPMTFSQGVPRPDHLIIVTIGEPETSDPAWCYDTASAELITHVTEPLIRFAVDRTLPRAEQGRTDEFAPALAESWVVETIDETSP
jgi:ABC-type transport system substrate-binding protein